MEPTENNKALPPIWYDIADPTIKVKCQYCKKKDLSTELVFINIRDGIHPDLIVHRKCVGEAWLEANEKGEPAKERGVSRIWHVSGWPPKLKLVKKPKIDYSLPAEMKKKKSKKKK